MERFKINSMSKIPIPLYRHSRRKSDQVYNKDCCIHINPQPSVARLQNASNAFYRSSILIRNPSIRSHSNDIKKKISLDLSKIRNNIGNINLSARGSGYQQKFSQMYLRKKSDQTSNSNPCTERIQLKIKEKENISSLKPLEPGPDIDAIFTNKFLERLTLFENRLSVFYSKKSQ